MTPLPLLLLLPILLLLFPAGCTIHREQGSPSPMSQALGNMPTGGANIPLEPGRQRPPREIEAIHPKLPLVLMSISGGGSRSAYYAACVMEQLAHVSVPGPYGTINMLDQVRVISTVSGGGLPAAYFVTHFHERHDPAFFPKFKKAMAVNLQWKTYGHMVTFPPLALELLSPTITRTDLLASEIQRQLDAGPVTFDDLLQAELRPVDPAPTLIVNGTVYNSGQRIAFTNLPDHRFPSLLEGDTGAIALGTSDREILRNLVQPLTMEDIGSDVGAMKVSRALAASAAYPLALAPIPLKTYPANVPPSDGALGQRNTSLLQSPVVYVADGGLHENEGIDSLLSMIKTLPRNQPVMLISIDGTVRMETLHLGAGKVWGPSSVISRMYDIGNLRPLAFYGAVAARFHDPEQMRGVVVRMEGYDPETDKMLQNIPTMFKLSNKHRDALEKAAVQNVVHMLPSILASYQDLLP